MVATPPPKATQREWFGLAVIALPCLLYSMDLTALNLATAHLSADLERSSSQLLWIVDIYGFLLAGCLVTIGHLRRPHRPPQIAADWCGGIWCGLSAGRLFYQCANAHSRPGRAGHRVRYTRSLDTFPYPQHVLGRAGANLCDRHMDGLLFGRGQSVRLSAVFYSPISGGDRCSSSRFRSWRRCSCLARFTYPNIVILRPDGWIS